MKSNLLTKAVEIILVVIGLLIGLRVFQKVDPEVFLKKQEAAPGMQEIEESYRGEYVGKPAGEDIPRISGSEEFEETLVEPYITAEPKSVVATGIYGRKLWMDEYNRSYGGRKYNKGRRAPEATDSTLMALDGYQEYYLIELSDGSYILAQFSETYRKKIEKGEVTELLIGQQKANRDSARKYLKEICDKYGASTTYTLYMVDDAWEQEHRFSVFMIKFGIAAVVFFVFSVMAIMAADKVIHRNEKTE